MEWTIDEIKKALKGKLIGNSYMKEIVCKTLLLLPSETIGFICTNVWFISSPEDAWALTFRGEELKERSLIFISDELLQQDESQIMYTILHEIGHVILNHRNSIGYKQTQTEIDAQEVAADNFAKEYLSQ